RDVLALRSTLDDRDEAYLKDIGAISRRLDRLERVTSRDVTSSIRVSSRVAPRKKMVKRKHRARTAAAARSPWDEPQATFAAPSAARKGGAAPGPAARPESGEHGPFFAWSFCPPPPRSQALGTLSARSARPQGGEGAAADAVGWACPR